MNSFEIFLLTCLCASFVVGPLLGYRAGRVEGFKAGQRSTLRILREKAFDEVTQSMIQVLEAHVRRPE